MSDQTKLRAKLINNVLKEVEIKPTIFKINQTKASNKVNPNKTIINLAQKVSGKNLAIFWQHQHANGKNTV